jgi:hypothetical protein
MVTITHVRFDGEGTSAEHIVMLRWRQAIGDTNITDMIQWIESGGIALVQRPGEDRTEDVKVVREAGRKPYLVTIADGLPTQSIVELPRF